VVRLIVGRQGIHNSIGNVAPPAIPIISNALPVLVSFPRLFIARGQMAGHIIAFANPSKQTKRTDENPFENIIIKEKIIPINADIDK
jgi:hypothetical protein